MPTLPEIMMLVRANVNSAKKGLQEVRQATKETSSSMDILTTAGAQAAGMLLRDMVNSATRAFSEIVNLGGSIQTLRTSFDRLLMATGTTKQSFENLKKATLGLVADVDLLESANKAMSLGLPIDDLDELYEASIRVGAAQGMTAKKSIDDFTIALGRQQPKILDNFGIQLQLTEAHEEYAKMLGKSVAALTESERESAFMIVAIKKLKEQANILGDNISETTLAHDRFATSIKNLKTRIGEMLGPLGEIGPILEGIMPMIGTLAATMLPKLFSNLGSVKTALKGVKLEAVATAGAISALTAIIGWAAIETWNLYQQQVALKDRLEEGTLIWDVFWEKTEKLDRAMTHTAAGMKRQAESIKGNKDALIAWIEKLDWALIDLQGFVGILKAVGWESGAVKEAFEETGYAFTTESELMKKEAEEWKNVWDDVSGEIQSSLDEIRSAAEDTINEFDKLTDDLKDDFNLLRAETASSLDAIAEHFDRVFSEGRFKDAAWMIKAFASVWDISWSEAERILRDRANAIKDTIEESLVDKAQSALQEFKECSRDKMLELQDTFEDVKARLREKWQIGAEYGGTPMEAYRGYKAELAKITESYEATKGVITSTRGPQGMITLSQGTPTSTELTVNFNMTGAIDKKTADYAVDKIRKLLKSIVIEDTSSQAVTSRIRVPR